MGDARGSPEDRTGETGTLDDQEENRVIRFYLGLRREVSLLLSEGHQFARQYPIAVVWSEARIVRQRQAARRKLDASLMQMVIGSMFSAKAGKRLAAELKGMDESD